MKTVIFFLILLLLSVSCHQNTPLTLGEKFDGEGFIITHDPTKLPVVFFPARTIDRNNYLQSLSANNIGNGITLNIYDINYVISISNPRQRFKLLNSTAVHYPLDSIYVLPVRVKYHGLEQYAHEPKHVMNIITNKFILNKKYLSNSIRLDSIIFLPYKVNK